MRGLSTQPMRRALTLFLVAAQVFALGWATLADELPPACGALWRAASVHDSTTAAQPREISARSTYAVAAQNMLWPRTIQRAAAAADRRMEGFVSVPPLSRPERSPQPPLVLRI